MREARGVGVAVGVGGTLNDVVQSQQTSTRHYPPQLRLHTTALRMALGRADGLAVADGGVLAEHNAWNMHCDGDMQTGAPQNLELEKICGTKQNWNSMLQT